MEGLLPFPRPDQQVVNLVFNTHARSLMRLALPRKLVPREPKHAIVRAPLAIERQTDSIRSCKYPPLDLDFHSSPTYATILGACNTRLMTGRSTFNRGRIVCATANSGAFRSQRGREKNAVPRCNMYRHAGVDCSPLKVEWITLVRGGASETDHRSNHISSMRPNTSSKTAVNRKPTRTRVLLSSVLMYTLQDKRRSRNLSVTRVGLGTDFGNWACAWFHARVHRTERADSYMTLRATRCRKNYYLHYRPSPLEILVRQGRGAQILGPAYHVRRYPAG
ncbi:unnamed protein product [Ectocarpus sp. 13 AM-2016]